MAEQSPRPNWHKVVKSYDRRQKAALTKVHLPTAEDLIYGVMFFGGELEGDVREFAHRSAPVADSLGLYALAVALTELSMSPSREAVENLTYAIEGWALSSRAERFLDVVLLRRRIYLAAWGDSSALSSLAMETINAAFGQRFPPTNNDSFLVLLFRAMELLATAATFKPFQPYLPGNRLWQFHDADKTLLQTRGIRQIVSRLILQEEDKDSQDNPSPTGGIDLDDWLDSLAPPSGATLTVIPAIGNSTTSEGKVAASFASGVAGVALPLTAAIELAALRSSLLAEFPHAHDQIEILLRSLGDGRPVNLQPTIIVGAPGAGKSHFCKRLMESLGLKYTMVPFAGMSDSAVIGTARRYSTGEPSLPVSTIIAHKIANPGIILDEVEKAGTGTHNGNAIESILPMLERVTASSYYDPYLQAPVDISHINWLMTANSLSALSRPFRDRCRVIEFPAPTKEHLATYVTYMVPDLAKERGQTPEMFQLDGIHLSSLGNWTDGSFRTLKSMLRAILEEHERHGRSHQH